MRQASPASTDDHPSLEFWRGSYSEISIPNQEDHEFYPWVNWSPGTGCSPLVSVYREPRALPVGLHEISIASILSIW